jgi:hypothetical protein
MPFIQGTEMNAISSFAAYLFKHSQELNQDACERMLGSDGMMQVGGEYWQELSPDKKNYYCIYGRNFRQQVRVSFKKLYYIKICKFMTNL